LDSNFEYSFELCAKARFISELPGFHPRSERRQRNELGSATRSSGPLSLASQRRRLGDHRAKGSRCRADFDSEDGSQTDCFLTGQSEVQNESPAALARKRRFLRPLDRAARAFPSRLQRIERRTSADGLFPLSPSTGISPLNFPQADFWPTAGRIFRPVGPF
jgi:hypothetical protein